ncbi:GIY-YIG nuclease family protein [Leifsonia sp. YIM 134122]|uniref:GIY-YIG nuclease family protein n=1 Tax=Leifsonia stereocauli TaxID=3134136 RepID=A0ABU9W483_9MICO
MAFMYILECRDGTFYTGSTTHLRARVAQHREGDGAKYTARRRPIRVRYYEEYARIGEAFAREKMVQGWNHERKEWLIEHGPGVKVVAGMEI